MSTTQSAPGAASSLSAWAHKAEASIAHAAGWLLAKLGIVEKDVAAVEASDPLVAEAVQAGEAYAAAHGVPVAQIAVTADAVVKLAQDVAGAPK